MKKFKAILLITFFLSAALSTGICAQQTDTQPSADKNRPEKTETGKKPADIDSGQKESAKQDDENSENGSEKQKPAKTAEDKKHEARLKRLKQVLLYGSSRQVREALSRMHRLSDEEQRRFVPELKKLSTNPDALIRRKIAELIGRVSWDDLNPELTHLIQADSDPVFFAAVMALRKKKVEEALKFVHKQIKEADYSKPGNRLPDMIELLAQYKDKTVADFLFEKMKDDTVYYEFRTRIMSYMADAGVKKPEVIEYLKKTALDSSESVTLRAYAVYALGILDVREVRDDLKKELERIDAIADLDEKRRYARLRLQLIAALTRMDDPEVMQVLYQLARDDDEIVRLRAVRQLGELQKEEARELLEFKAEYDTSIEVQSAAKKALEKLDEARKQKPGQNLTEGAEQPSNGDDTGDKNKNNDSDKTDRKNSENKSKKGAESENTQKGKDSR